MRDVPEGRYHTNVWDLRLNPDTEVIGAVHRTFNVSGHVILQRDGTMTWCWCTIYLDQIRQGVQTSRDRALERGLAVLGTLIQRERSRRAALITAVEALAS